MYPAMESQITSPRYSTENVITPTPVIYPPPLNERPSNYSSDQVIGPNNIPASGIPNPAYHHHHHHPPPHQLHYATPYISTSLTSRNIPVAGPQEWSTGLCHCCDDPDNCLITAFCPCVTFGQIAEIVNEGSPSCKERGALYGVLLAISGLACLYSCFYRSKLRARYDLREEPCGDCLVHFCCETCALCQEYRELNHRGFDMGIGWEANMDRQKRGLTPPIVVPGMRR